MNSKIQHFVSVPGTKLQYPETVICGAQEGLRVTVSAGVHCREYVGIQAVIELAGSLDPKDICGELHLVHAFNYDGLICRCSDVFPSDGKNLNRVFPGDREGSEAERLAHMLFEVFIRNADAYIDLHCGDGYETLITYCYYLGDAPAEETAKRMVECVNVKYVVRSHCRTGGAYNLASLHGVPSVLIERGQLSLFSR